MSAEATAPSRLARRLGTVDAVAMGLGSMIGAGVFAAFAPAARAAGNGLLVGLGIAALVASELRGDGDDIWQPCCAFDRVHTRWAP